MNLIFCVFKYWDEKIFHQTDNDEFFFIIQFIRRVPTWKSGKKNVWVKHLLNGVWTIRLGNSNKLYFCFRVQIQPSERIVQCTWDRCSCMLDSHTHTRKYMFLIDFYWHRYLDLLWIDSLEQMRKILCATYVSCLLNVWCISLAVLVRMIFCLCVHIENQTKRKREISR